MTVCLALTRKWKPCRNHASIGHHTCTQHRSFFDNPQAIKESWFSLHQGGYAHFLHLSKWTSEWIESCLQYKVIQITKEDIENMPKAQGFRFSRYNASCWAYFLLLCARHVPEFRISWNPELWDTCLKRLWYWSERIGIVQITIQDLQLLLCVKGSIQEFHKGVHTLNYEIFLKECSQNLPEWYEDFITAPIEEHSNLLRFRDSHSEHIQKLRKEFLEHRILRCHKMKKQILAVAWHTSRFLLWTLTQEEVDDIKKRWTNFPPSKPLKSVLEDII